MSLPGYLWVVGFAEKWGKLFYVIMQRSVNHQWRTAMQQLLQMLIGQQNQSNISDMMEKFGLDENQARQAIGTLLPSVTQGIQKQAQSQNEGILSQLANAQQQRYLDDDKAHLYDDDAVSEGNDILGQILGSKDVSRQLAGRAAQQTGLDTGILKKMLPMVASMAMGAIGKQANAQGVANNQGGLMDLVGSFLGGQNNTDDDGFGLDDVMNIAGKFLR
ncbi:MAG: hypothetical protein CR975_06675 [Gammaproteobacteria bacterium]|nr:MAG: hypothetical protein CR975_06675 [Gammaproteobacteria bacterium]